MEYGGDEVLLILETFHKLSKEAFKALESLQQVLLGIGEGLENGGKKAKKMNTFGKKNKKGNDAHTAKKTEISKKDPSELTMEDMLEGLTLQEESEWKEKLFFAEQVIRQFTPIISSLCRLRGQVQEDKLPEDDRPGNLLRGNSFYPPSIPKIENSTAASQSQPILKKKSTSLTEVNDLAAAQSAITGGKIVEDSTDSFKPIESSGAKISAEEQAVIAIQRWYRYHKVRQHFTSVKANLRSESEERIQVLKKIKWASGSNLESTDSQTELRMSEISKLTRSFFTSPSFSSTDLMNSPDKETFTQKKHFYVGIHKFNENPEKGMKYMIANGIIPEDEEEVAKFLFECKKLNKAKVGDYISLGKEFTNGVLESYVQFMDFRALQFDQALRKFLSDSNFRLPGEAQKIDRIMTVFGKHFQSYEPKFFTSADTAYVLAFSTIMLNTDAHNPSVKKKMTLKDFIRNNSKIDSGKNLPEEFLAKLYASITQSEIKMKVGGELQAVLDLIEGQDLKPLNEDTRRFIKQFPIFHIADILARTPQRSERYLFLFNDCFLVTKKKRLDFQFAAPLTRMRIEDFKDTTVHQNVIDICDSQGRLMTISFMTPQDKASFLEEIKEGMEETACLEHDKRQSLKELIKRLNSTRNLEKEDTLGRKALNLLRGSTRVKRNLKAPIPFPATVAENNDSPMMMKPPTGRRKSIAFVPQSPSSSDLFSNIPPSPSSTSPFSSSPSPSLGSLHSSSSSNSSEFNSGSSSSYSSNNHFFRANLLETMRSSSGSDKRRTIAFDVDRAPQIAGFIPEHSQLRRSNADEKESSGINSSPGNLRKRSSTVSNIKGIDQEIIDSMKKKMLFDELSA